MKNFKKNRSEFGNSQESRKELFVSIQKKNAVRDAEEFPGGIKKGIPSDGLKKKKAIPRGISKEVKKNSDGISGKIVEDEFLDEL